MKNCSQSLKKWKDGHRIFRAVSNDNDFLKLSPSGRLRKSAYSSNHYNLFMNYHKIWSKFPKREVICSGGSGERAMEHNSNQVYYVLPYDGTILGICPEDDIWNSFKLLNKINIQDLNELNVVLSNFYSDDNWNVLSKQLKDTEIWSNFVKKITGSDKGLVDSMKNGLEFLEYYLNPKKNGFQIKNINNFKLTSADDKEVWFNAPCVLIETFRDEILDELSTK